MFDYTVRNADGSVKCKTITREAAERAARESKGAYIKDRHEPVYPLKEKS